MELGVLEQRAEYLVVVQHDMKCAPYLAKCTSSWSGIMPKEFFTIIRILAISLSFSFFTLPSPLELMLDRVGIEVTRFWDVAMLGEAKTRALQPFLQRIPRRLLKVSLLRGLILAMILINIGVAIAQISGMSELLRQLCNFFSGCCINGCGRLL